MAKELKGDMQTLDQWEHRTNMHLPRAWFFWCVFAGFLGFVHPASAHQMRAVYFELVEHRNGRYLGIWQSTVDDQGVAPVFPAQCKVRVKRIPSELPGRSYQLHCPSGLTGQRISIGGLGPSVMEVVVRFQRNDGKVISKLLTHTESSWTLPKRTSLGRVVVEYIGLGTSHVLGGWDHMLFLLALLLLVRKPKAMVWTATAFTFSHSVTLALTALQKLRVSPEAAEACIALSLVLSAWDVTRREQFERPERLGIWMGLLFGLVHGLGFAGSLLEIGFPADAVGWSLLGFNLGVECAQLLALGVGMLTLHWVRPSWTRAVDLGGAYLVGICGSYWLWLRTWALLTH